MLVDMQPIYYFAKQRHWQADVFVGRIEIIDPGIDDDDDEE